MVKPSQFFASKAFKKFTLILSVIFIVASFFVALDPRPFLQFGYLGIFVYNLFGTGIVIVPVFSRYYNVILVAFLAALGMSVNDAVSWYAGKTGQIIIPPSPRMARIHDKIVRYGPWAIFFWALIPFPFDIIAVAAGYLRLPFWRFLIPMFLGRFVRFLLLGSGSIALWGKVLDN